MSNEDAQSGFPPPIVPPPPSLSHDRKIRGSFVILGGFVFAFMPLLITLVASIFINDALNEGSSAWGTLPWLTILTMPIGGLIVVIGLVIGATNQAQLKRSTRLRPKSGR